MGVIVAENKIGRVNGIKNTVQKEKRRKKKHIIQVKIPL